jgi:acetyl esterase/lipase
MMSASPLSSPGASSVAQPITQHTDIVYATVGGGQLALDLYMPAGIEHPPLMIWVHGGRWVLGDKSEVPMAFVAAGIATASVDFRQSDEARFPAMVHDIKAAVRFLRAKASEYGYRTDRVAIGGTSSGAHLAALVGTTNGHPVLEGTVGDHPEQSSVVEAILSYYGASNLTTILAQSTPQGLDVRVPALEALLGAPPDQAHELAQLASPVIHVNRSAPPLLLLHGDQDPQMPVEQSFELEAAYKLRGLDVHFDVLHGAAHGGESDFFSEERNTQAIAFLRRTLLQ